VQPHALHRLHQRAVVAGALRGARGQPDRRRGRLQHFLWNAVAGNTPASTSACSEAKAAIMSASIAPVATTAAMAGGRGAGADSEQ
jgi:hypothetical protein